MAGLSALSVGACAMACAIASSVLVSPLTTDLASAQARQRTPLRTNLIRNGGAERGGASYPDSVVGRVPAWKRGGRFTVVTYGIDGFLPRSESERIGGRQNHFSCGSVSPKGTARQRIELVGRRRAVDARRIAAILQAYVSAPAMGGDRGRIVLRFLDGFSRRLARQKSPWIRDTALRMIATSVSTVVPRGTRSIEVVLKGERKSGLICNAFFEKVDLRIMPT